MGNDRDYSNFHTLYYLNSSWANSMIISTAPIKIFTDIRDIEVLAQAREAVKKELDNLTLMLIEATVKHGINQFLKKTMIFVNSIKATSDKRGGVIEMK